LKMVTGQGQHAVGLTLIFDRGQFLVFVLFSKEI